MAWDNIADSLDSQDAKKRLEAISELRVLLGENTATMAQLREILGYIWKTLEDSNVKVCQGGLQLAADFLDVTENMHDFRSFVPSFLAAVGDKLGDAKQVIRQEASNLLERLGKRCGAQYLLEKALGSGWWSHKNWRMRQGIASVSAAVCSKVGLETMGDEDKLRFLIEPCAGLLEDPNSSVRDAAMDCFEEVHKLMGGAMMEALTHYNIRPATMRELGSKFDSEHTAPFTIGSQHRSSIARDRRPSKQNSAGKGMGSVDANGGLPQITPKTVESDRDLKEEIDTINAGLALSEEWDKRILALARLEGILLGGAARLESCCDALRGLKDSLTAQINDRRSAVSRQACHAVATMAAALGSRFEVEAVFFLPVVFKVLIITVQVMAEAADLCVHSILRYCKSGRLVPKICDVLVSDRNAKSRQHCSKFLLQVLEEWPKSAYERQIDWIENGIKSATQDTSMDTRMVGRLAFGAYQAACPDRAKAFLKKLDGGLQQKLVQSLPNYLPGSVVFPTISPLPEEVLASTKRPANTQSSLTGTPQSNRFHKKMSTSSPRPEQAQQTNMHLTGPAAFLTPIAEASSNDGAPQGNMSADGCGIGEMTWPLAQIPRNHMEVECVSEISGREKRLSAFGAPQRCQTEPRSAQGGRYLSDVALGTPRSLHSAGSWNDGDEEMPDVCPPGIPDRMTQPGGSKDVLQNSMEMKTSSLTKLLSVECANSTKGDWQAKLEVLDKVYEILQGSSWGPGELSHEGYRMAQFFQSRIEDAHFRVVDKALSTLCIAIDCAAQIFEAHLDRLMPLLFHKVVDQKDIIQKQAKCALEGMAQNYSADVLLPSMIRSLESIKTPKGISAIMEYSCLCLGEDTAAGVPSVPSFVRLWVMRLTGFVSDKNVEVRRLAVNALHNVYQNMDSSAIMAHLAQASPDHQMLLRKALGDLLPDFQQSEARLSTSSQRPKASLGAPHSAQRTQASSRMDEVVEDVGNPSTSHGFVDGGGMGTGSARCKENSPPRNAKQAEFSNGFRTSDFDTIVQYVLRGDFTNEHLKGMMLLVVKHSTEKWSPIFEKILKQLLSNLVSNDSAKLDLILATLKHFLTSHRTLLRRHMVPTIINHVLACAHDKAIMVQGGVKSLLALMMKFDPSPATFSMMADFLVKNISCDIPEDVVKSAKMRCCIESMSYLFGEMASEEISQVFSGKVLESLVTAWKSPNVEVRKAVVCCLARACFTMGLSGTDFMETLSTSQAKLLEVYIKKAGEGRQQLGI